MKVFFTRNFCFALFAMKDAFILQHFIISADIATNCYLTQFLSHKLISSITSCKIHPQSTAKYFLLYSLI